MKPIRTLAIVIAGLVIAGAVCSKPASAGVSFDFFYSNLSRHGDWHVSASYGRVWQPAVYHSGWNPYYDGHWVHTDLGWCWDSDYAWGGLPYHYGTWAHDPYYGWVWVPGYTWAPAWVVFREGPDYIGWAPVQPGFSVGVSFNIGSYPADRFVFVRSGDFLCDRVRFYAVPSARTRIIVNNTTIINNNISVVNNVVVNRGPRVSVVERAAHRTIQTVPVERVKSVRTLSGGTFSRDLIRLDPGRSRHAIRAAEPVSEKTPLPTSEARRVGEGATHPRAELRRGPDLRAGRDAGRTVRPGQGPESGREIGTRERSIRSRSDRGPGGEGVARESSRESGGRESGREIGARERSIRSRSERGPGGEGAARESSREIGARERSIRSRSERGPGGEGAGRESGREIGTRERSIRSRSDRGPGGEGAVRESSRESAGREAGGESGTRERSIRSRSDRGLGREGAARESSRESAGREAGREIGARERSIRSRSERGPGGEGAARESGREAGSRGAREHAGGAARERSSSSRHGQDEGAAAREAPRRHAEGSRDGSAHARRARD